MRNLLFLLMLCASAALADERPPAPPDEKLKQDWEQRFRAADKDRSRALDRAEAAAGLPKILSRNFDAIDTDRDGRITPAELWAMHQREVVERDRRRAARVAGPPR
jgi:Ca2+-binding EF-hand superfamily protein